MHAGNDLGSAAKVLVIGLEVASSGVVSCHFFILTMCSSLACLSFVIIVHRPSSLVIN